MEVGSPARMGTLVTATGTGPALLWLSLTAVVNGVNGVQGLGVWGLFILWVWA